MWQWLKVQKTDNYKYLGTDAKIDDFSIESSVLFGNVYDSFINLVGLSEDYKKLLETKRKFCIEKANFIITEDKKYKMNAKFVEVELVALERRMSEKSVGSIEQTTIILEKNLGIKLDLKKITVKEYYDYLDFFSKNGNNI